MALYWHPFLADLLRHRYADRLLIYETVALGDLPLEADLLLIRRDPRHELPYPFALLGERTLVEYKSPDESADQAALQQLETYALLYLQRAELRTRQSVTLWLAASQFARDVSQRGAAELVQQFEAGPGVIGGSVDGFPTYLVDLQEVPFTEDTLPLHLVARGAQEQRMVEYVLDHYQTHPRELDLVERLHPRKLLEVLQMRQLTPEQIGLDYPALLALIGKERAINLIGEEEFINVIGEERLRQLLARRGQPPSTEVAPPSAEP
jgi:hypothetical protein